MAPLSVTLALAVLLSAVPAISAQEARDVDAVLAAIEAIELPSYDRDRRDEEGYRDEYFAQRALVDAERDALAGELFALEPGHADLLQLLPARWGRLLGEQTDAAVSEMDAVITGYASAPLVNLAYYWKGRAAMPGRDAEAMAHATGAFRRAFPEDEQGARMLSDLASLYAEEPERAVATYNALIEAYPEYRSIGYMRGKVRQIEQLGQPFELAFDDATTGRRVDLAELRGKLVVVDFWATWCGPCVAEMPHMQELYAEFAPQGVEFVGVSLDSSKADGGLDKLKAYVAEHEIPWPQYYQGFGWEGEFSTSWGINSIPALFVVDRDGSLVSVKARGQLEILLPELLGRAE
ncbi:MAG: hypothetical protein DRQ55_01475 [Planctomycetota bacterium]|nr:MAG: hypothetical protein DRQ55_01475 [Planctomycetota bacterium]